MFFSQGAILADNHGFTLNASNLIYRPGRLRWICVLMLALFFISGRWANADPVGDFFKKVGQSVSKAFQPQPAQQQKARKVRSSRRPGSRIPTAPEASPSPTAPEELAKPEKEEKPAATLLPASAAPAEKAKGDLPYGIPVPSRKGMVTSPYLPEGNYVDVSIFAPGSAVKDPYTGKLFRVP
jgi:hypothetical protein